MSKIASSALALVGHTPLVETQRVAAELQRLRAAQLGEAFEETPRIVEGGVPQHHETLQEPAFDIGLVGIHVDREIEEIAHRGARAAVRVHAGRLQHVEALDYQDVGALYHRPLVRDDVVDDVAVDGGRHPGLPGFHVDHELQQRPAVVGLGKTLAVHQAPFLQLRRRQQETVGGDQVNLRVPRGAPQ